MQVNQNVNAANFLLVGNQAVNSFSSKEEPNVSVDFANVLKNTNDSYSYQYNENASYSSEQFSVSSKQTETTVKNDSVVSDAETSQGTDRIDSKKSDVSSNETVSVKEKVDGKNDSAQDVNEEGLETDAQQQNVGDIVTDLKVMESAGEISEEDMSALLEVVSNLLQEVMNYFDLSLEELNTKLDALGMEATDLLNMDGLKEFFLQMNQADVSDLIVDEELNMQLQDFMNEVSDLLQSMEMITPDADKLVTMNDIQSVFMENAYVSDDNQDSIVVEHQEDVQELEGEPEVIVVNNTQEESELSKESDHMKDSSKQQSKDVSSTTMKEVAPADNVSAKQPSFENPILQAIQNAVHNVEATVASEQSVRQTDIIQQIVEQVRVNLNQQSTSMELQLYPEHLGRIQIQVVSKDGVMTASILAETEAAKQAIEGGLLNLKEAMQQQDLKVEAIEVMVSTMGFERGEEQQQSFDEKGSSNPRRRIDLSELGEDISVEDEVEIEKMKATGSSKLSCINY